MSNEDKIWDKFTDYLVESKQKLAESEKRFQEHKQVDAKTIQEQADLIEELKQQLAEKDKQILELQEQSIRDNQIYNEELAEKEKENLQLKNKILYSQMQVSKEHMLRILSSDCVQYNPNQDKISFAVEQLSCFKKLRGLILNMRMTGFEEYRDKIPMKYLAMVDAHIEKLADIIDDQIDNKIKQLKGEE